MMELADTMVKSLPLLALSFLVALSAVLVSLPFLSRAAIRLSVVDRPSQRKTHEVPKPLVGGVGMAFAVFVSLFLCTELTGMTGLLAAMVAVISVGMIDDRRGLNCWWKLLVQVAAALCIVYWSKVSLSTFGDILSLGSIDFKGISLPVTIFCIVGVANAFNMIDGIDGLAGGVSLITFLSFTGLAALNGQPALMLLSGAMCGAVIGFLRSNWHPARLFMGDAGSLFLGCTAAFVSIALTQEGQSFVPPVVPLLILALPITDALTVILKRIVNGRSPFYADRTHLHYTLYDSGLGIRGSVGIMLLISLLFSMLAIAGTLYGIPEHWLFLIFTLYFVVHMVFSFFGDRVIGRKVSYCAEKGTLPHATMTIREGEFASQHGSPISSSDQNRIPFPNPGLDNQPVNMAAAGRDLLQQECLYKNTSRR